MNSNLVSKKLIKVCSMHRPFSVKTSNQAIVEKFYKIPCYFALAQGAAV